MSSTQDREQNEIAAAREDFALRGARLPNSVFLVQEHWLPNNEDSYTGGGAGARTLAIFRTLHAANAYAASHVRLLERLTDDSDKCEADKQDYADFLGKHAGTFQSKEQVPHGDPKVTWHVRWKKACWTEVTVEEHQVFEAAEEKGEVEPLAHMNVN